MRVKATLLALLVTGCAAACLTVASAQAQQPMGKTVEVKSALSRGAGADENIRVARTPNKADASVPAPTSKGGEKTRGTTSIVHVDNRTNWYIDIYLDGSYCSTIGPWGDIYCYVGTGNTRMYGHADFVDGPARTWGPTVDYVDGTYIWKLLP